MYLRCISRTNKDGSKVTYLQLTHNVRDSRKGYTKAQVLYSFGRIEQVDEAALKRLVGSICRFLSPEDALKAQAAVDGSELKFIGAKPLGGAWLLRQLWERIGLDGVIGQALRDREFSTPVEWAIFAMVANRALAPDSKRRIEEWVEDEVALLNPEPVRLQHLYRAMDFLLEHEEEIQRKVFNATADLFNLEVDLILFDTTSTYFETDEEDEDGLRRYGHSKDHRSDLPQVVIGLAVTKDGIPVRCWVLPGNTHDSKTVERVQSDLAGWKLTRVVWVMDRGMTSAANKVALQRAGGHYILGEKLGDNQESHREALSRGGRFKKIRDNLLVKEVVVGDGTRRERFVVVFNPQQAELDRATRKKNLDRIEEALAASRCMSPKSRQRAEYNLLAHRSLGRYLRQLKNGELRLNSAKIKAEEKTDGKYLISTSDDSLSAEDAALGYKQLMEVERAFRTLKTTLDLRPIYHRKDDRIRSHVLLCWLALLLVRVSERETKRTWDNIRRSLDRLVLGQFFGPQGMVLQSSELTNNQLNIFKSLKIRPPKQYIQISSKA